MNGRDVWSLARKTGYFGGMFDVDATYEYFEQPGTFDMHFDRVGTGYVYTPQDIEREGPAAYIKLSGDVIPFGNTQIWIMGNKESGPPYELAYAPLPNGYTRYPFYIQVNAQDLVNQDYNELFFEARTKATNPNVNQYSTMYASDYREQYNSTPAIYGNPFYRDTLFKGGDPVRTISENPLENPKRYWPYTLPINPVLNILNPPTNLSATSSYPYTSVNLTWNDNSNYESGYEIWRKGVDHNWQKIDEVPQNTTSYIDNSVSIFQDYFYKVRAFAHVGNQTIYSDFSDSAWVTTCPLISFGNISLPPSGKAIIYKNNRYHCVYTEDNKVYYTFSQDNGITWTHELIDTGRNPCIEYVDGKIWVFYIKNPPIYYNLKCAIKDGNIWQKYTTNYLGTNISATSYSDTVFLFFEIRDTLHVQYRIIFLKIVPTIPPSFTPIDTFTFSFY